MFMFAFEIFDTNRLQTMKTFEIDTFKHSGIIVTIAHLFSLLVAGCKRLRAFLFSKTADYDIIAR